jgi:hypothetical protein
LRNIRIKRVISACFFQRWATFLLLPFLALFAQLGRASDALNYTKNYFVTGDYVVGGVGLFEKGVRGTATGTLTIAGVPQGADIIAAFLYWQTSEITPNPSAANGFFDGNAIVGDPRGNPTNVACGSVSVAQPIQGRVYRADVLRYLAVDTTNNVRLANGPHTVQLPDAGVGGGGMEVFPTTSGATLVVVYRVLTLGTPLRAVVIYDGAYSMVKSGDMSQTVGGFYQTSYPAPTAAKMTQIVSNGQPGLSQTLKVNGQVISTAPFNGAQGPRWDNPTFSIGLGANVASYTTEVTGSQVCLEFSAIVTSMGVQDTDGDGLLDVWETQGMHLNPGTLTQPATFGTCAQFQGDGFPCVNLPAMGAKPTVKDIFVEIDWEQGTAPGDGPNGHLHIPKIGALSMMAASFLTHGIQLHFDVGNNYQSPKASYIVPAQYAQGGQVIQESTLECPNAQTNVCIYPNTGYAVQGWKIGFQAIKDGFPLLNIPAYFNHNRKDIFHYVLFGHALATPSSVPGVPSSVSGVADRPGGDVFVTLGLWLSDDPVPCDPTSTCANETGSVLVQAGTLMHELGHNLGLSHAGLYRAPNCEPNYPSVMNYLYQTRGLTDVNGNSQIDYSYGTLPQLNESVLSESAFQNTPLKYKVRYYGPPTSLAIGLATLHCDGTPINGEQAVRLESPFGPTIDWNNNGLLDPGTYGEDVDFNGFIGDPVQDSVDPLLPLGANGKLWLADTNDWANLNLPQISARMDVAGLSADVGQADLGQADLGQADLGQADLGQADLGQADLGQADLGQADLGQADLGDVAYNVAISTLDATSSTQPLVESSSLTGVTLNWGLPSLGQIRTYNIYRSDPLNPTPVIIASLSGNNAPPATTYTDTVNQPNAVGPAPANTTSGTFYNTKYTYFVAAVDINGTSSGPSNSVTGIVDHWFVTATNKTRVYGNVNPALTFTTAGIKPSVETGTNTCTTTAIQSSNVVVPSPYTITCAGLTPLAGVSYITGTFTITPAPLKIAAVTNTKIYDSTTSAAGVPNVTGLKLSDTVTGLAETYDTKNVGTGKTLSVSAYTVNDNNGGNNYTVTTATNATGVTKKAPLTIKATGINKVYDSTVTATVTLSDNRFSGDVFTDSYASATFGNKKVGTGKTVSVTGISIAGTDAGNYTFNANASTTANITPAPLTITATGINKVYDGTLTATVTLSDNRFAGDVFTDTYTGATFLDRNVGTSKPVNVTGISIAGTDAANYTFNATASTTANITPAPLTAAIVAANKTYDTTQTATITSCSIAVVLTIDNGNVACLVGGALFATANVGTQTVTATVGLTGSAAGNYSLPSIAITTATIIQYPLTVTATGVNKAYDGTTNATVTLGDNRVAGDTSINETYTSASFLDPNVGTNKTVNVTGISLSGSGMGNYSLANTTATTTANITPALDLSNFNTVLTPNGVNYGSNSPALPTWTGSALQLTSDASQTASAWLDTEQAVSSAFSTSFEFQIAPVPNNAELADGFAFVIQFAPNGTSTLGSTGAGGYIGYTGIPNSIAIEFDTFQNSWDPAYTHIGVQSNGPLANSADHTTAAKLVTPVQATFADGAIHNATITYDGTSTLSVFLDGAATPVVTVPVNLSTLLTLDSGTSAFVGFTAATGAGSEYSDILAWTWN